MRGVIKKGIVEPSPSNPKLVHFILTRFNLKRNAELPEDWLQHRIALFEKYCLASVAAQTDKDFHWILMCEAATQDELSPFIERWADMTRFDVDIIPAWCNRFNSQKMGECLKPYIIGHHEVFQGTARGDCYLVMTRLDNDDALAPDFIELTQAKATSLIAKGQVPDKGVVLDAPVGYRYDKPRKHLYLWKRPYSPFQSLVIKSTASFRTIYSFPEGHGAVWKYSTVYSLSNRPLWLQVLHEQNITNSLRGNEQRVREIEKTPFAFLLQTNSCLTK